jgi:hypothetical protein
MSKTKIAKCSCKHDFQDARYGKGNRVFNYCSKTDKWRCTVCKKEK